MPTTIALSGDAIVNRRFSMVDHHNFLKLMEVFQHSDVGFTHLETILHDYEGPEIYPAAEAGGTWMRSPPFVADELTWMGIDMVSHASNHALDWGYGGLRKTWNALDEAGINHAGTGENLGDARSPTYYETENARIALVSMTSSFTPWSRAGETRNDVKGRPGVNPLRFHYTVDPETLTSIINLATQFGWWITRHGDNVLLNKPGTHNTIERYVESEEIDGARMTLNNHDTEGNLRAIADAATQSDITIAHLHTHEFAPDADSTIPPNCMEEFARDCADAGANIVIFQGTHAPIRGIEVYDGTPIFHDPGDLFFMSDTTTRLPAEFYYRHERDLGEHPFDATPAEGFAARGLVYPWGNSPSQSDDGSSFGGGDNLLNPPNGLFLGSGCIVPVCFFDDKMNLTRIEITPCGWYEEPKSLAGIPKAATGEQAEEILGYLDDLCDAYNTAVSVTDDIGVLQY